MSRYIHLNEADRLAIADSDEICVENGRQLLLNVRSGKVAGNGWQCVRQRQIEFAVMRWLRNSANSGFVHGGRFNSVASALRKAS